LPSNYPLVLSPDDVWLLLAQGFAQHVEAKRRGAASRFVRTKASSRSRFGATTS